jgi:hypothetical protein
MRAISIAKIGEGLINEDAAKATEKWIAVSDGAGGGGVFADLWSKYLVDHLPDEPVMDYQTFDAWIDGIWEPFYNECEEIAKREGGMLLNKFYDEGSFATLVAVWKDGHWMSYGDSVAFCYDKKSGKLQHTFGRIIDFNNPPYLINCKDPSDERGFRSGRFDINDDSIVFAASDAFAHYILMMYELTHKNGYVKELQEAIDAQTKNSNLIKTAMRLRKVDFAKDVIQKLQNCNYPQQMKAHIERLRRLGFIALDDYSLAIL